MTFNRLYNLNSDFHWVEEKKMMLLTWLIGNICFHNKELDIKLGTAIPYFSESASCTNNEISNADQIKINMNPQLHISLDFSMANKQSMLLWRN